MTELVTSGSVGGMAQQWLSLPGRLWRRALPMVRTLWFADVNNRGEAYTANLAGQKGGRTTLKRLQPR